MAKKQAAAPLSTFITADTPPEQNPYFEKFENTPIKRSPLATMIFDIVDWILRAIGLLACIAWSVMAFTQNTTAGLIVSAITIAFLVVTVKRWVKFRTWRDDPPTEKQLAFAKKLHIDVPRGTTKGKLHDMIDHKLKTSKMQPL